MTQKPFGVHADENGRADSSTRLDRLRARLETAEPAEAREAVLELMHLSAAGDGGEALKLAVRFSCRADYSDEELLRLWSTVEGDPDGFCEHLLAPAYCAGKAIRRLVELSVPGDGGEALKLAARFVSKDRYASSLLLRLWKRGRDPDGFAQHLLAPAFRHECRTELRLFHAGSLTGLRHLTMLTKLRLAHCEKIDLTEVGELAELTDLELTHCTSITDLTPIGRLTRLTRFELNGFGSRSVDLTPIGRLTRLTRLVVDVGSFEDTEPLLNLGRLRELNLKWANARSVHGFGRAFPALESLKLQGRGFRDMDGLRAIPHLTHLALSHLGQLRDLSPFAAMPRLESLRIENCENLTTLDGLGPHPRLAELAIDSCHSLHSLDGLGDQPELHTVKLFGGRSLTDLGGLARLPALHTLYINGTDLSDIDELAGSPLVELRLLWMKGLESLSSLQHCPGLKRLTLWGCPRVEDIPDSLESLSLTAADWKKHLPRIAGQENLRFLELVAPPEDISPLLGMPSLTHLRVHARSGIITDSGTLNPVIGELRKRGVSVAIGR